MATNITNTKIDEAIPNKGSGAPHAEQPNRKLTNAILKEIAAETNGLGTAATKNVGTGDDSVASVLQKNDSVPSFDSLDAVGYSPNAWNLAGNYITRLESKNNAMVFSVSGQFNDRQASVQVGHASASNANSTGVLHLNPLSGEVRINKKTALHTGNILTTTGQSTLYPMTQKATTDAINGISDERDKTEINEIGIGLEVIENINTVSFKLNRRDWYRQQAAKELIEVEDEDGKVTVQEKINSDVLNAPLSDFEENDGSLKRDDVYTGFVAQDLKETLESLGLGYLGIVKNYSAEYEGGEDRFYIEHLALLPFLVNSIKQLSARVKELEDAAE